LCVEKTIIKILLYKISLVWYIIKFSNEEFLAAEKIKKSTIYSIETIL